MGIALRIMQVLFALLFAGSGIRKPRLSATALAQSAPELSTLPLLFVRFIGVAELLAAIGLILPAATRTAPALIPAALLAGWRTGWLAGWRYLQAGQSTQSSERAVQTWRQSSAHAPPAPARAATTPARQDVLAAADMLPRPSAHCARASSPYPPACTCQSQ